MWCIIRVNDARPTPALRLAASPTGVDYEVAVVNNTAAPLPDKLRIVVQFCDMNGKRRKDLDKALLITPVPANKVQAFDLQVASVLNGMPLVVARTILTTRSRGVLAKNLDWIAGTATANPYPYAPLRALTHVNLNASGKGQYDRSSGCSEVTITIKNPTDMLAFFNRIRVWDPNPPGSGCPCPTLLSPVFLSDNYFSLLPGETTTVTLSFQFQGNRKPAIALTGWNSNPGTPDDIVPIRWR
jgi:mannosylglycoprotein endo-beta-mannosidase